MSHSESTKSALNWLHRRITNASELNAELFSQLRAEQVASGLLHDDRPICSFLRPLILSREVYESICHAAETLAVAFEQIANAALKDEDKREIYISGKEIE